VLAYEHGGGPPVLPRTWNMPKVSEARKRKEDVPEVESSLLRLSPLRVLLYDTDDASAREISQALVEVGATVHRTLDRVALATDLRERIVDALVLGGAGPNQLAVVLGLRERYDLPVVLVDEGDGVGQLVAGIQAGADDVVSRAHAASSVPQKVLSLVRRVRGQFGPVRRSLVIDDIALDPGALKGTRSNRDLGLTSYEFNILYALADRRGKVCSRETLIEAAGGTAEGAFERSIDVHVSRVRQKLGDDARQPAIIKTVRGTGYLFARPASDE
jgi:DNA-binding response OmpR family regulator